MSVQAPAFRAPQPVGFSGQLGKEQTCANAEDLFSRHGVGFGQPDSTPHPGTCSVSTELPQDFIRQDGGLTEILSEAPGAYGVSCGGSPARSAPYETASALAPWPSPEVGVATRYSPGSDYTGLPQNLQPPGTDPSFLRTGVPLEQVSRHAVVFTDASATGWGATYNGHAVSGVWTGPQLRWHINCLELLAVRLALSRLKGRLRVKVVLVRMDNTATVAYINRQGGLGSRCMSQLARHLLLWSQKHLRSFRAIHIPGVFNQAADELSRAALPPGGPADLESVRSCSGRPVCISGNHALPVVIFPIQGNARHGCTGTQLAPGPAQICVPPSEPASTDTLLDQGGRGADPVSGSILAQQDLVPGTHAPRDSSSLADSSEEGSAFSKTGHPLAPVSRLVEAFVVPGRDAEVLGDLPQEVALTIASA